EDLLAADAIVVGDAGEDYRLHVIAALEFGIAWHFRALERLGSRALLAKVDIGAHLLELLLRDDGADIGLLVERIAHFHGVHLRLELVDEGIVDGFVDEDAARGRAALALAGETHANHRTRHRLFEVGIAHDDHRALA